MLFMTIERFKDDTTQQIYYRSQQKGRMLPESLKYIEPIWDLFTKLQVQYPSGFHDSYSHLS